MQNKFQVVYETAVHEFDFQNEPDMNAITNKPKKTKKAETAVFTSYESGKDSVFLEYREYDQSKVKINPTTIVYESNYGLYCFVFTKINHVSVNVHDKL